MCLNYAQHHTNCFYELFSDSWNGREEFSRSLFVILSLAMRQSTSQAPAKSSPFLTHWLPRWGRWGSAPTPPRLTSLRHLTFQFYLLYNENVQSARFLTTSRNKRLEGLKRGKKQVLLLSREVGDLKSVRLPLALISETILFHCMDAPLVTLRFFYPLGGGPVGKRRK